MRVRLLLGSLCCLLLPLAPLLADSHRADSGFYVAVRAGSTFTDPASGSLVRMRDDYGSGYLIFYDSRFTYGTGVSVNGAAGYAFGALRLEAELSYAVTDLGYWTWEVRDDQGRFVNETVVLQRLDATGLTANLWYDIDTGTVFSPFWVAVPARCSSSPTRPSGRYRRGARGWRTTSFSGRRGSESLTTWERESGSRSGPAWMRDSATGCPPPWSRS